MQTIAKKSENYDHEKIEIWLLDGLKTGYYKFSEFEAIKIPKFLKALNFPTTFKGAVVFPNFFWL